MSSDPGAAPPRGEAPRSRDAQAHRPPNDLTMPASGQPSGSGPAPTLPGYTSVSFVEHLELIRGRAGPGSARPRQPLLDGQQRAHPDPSSRPRPVAPPQPDLEVVLVREEDLPGFVPSRTPLHPSYEHLSLIHRYDLSALLRHALPRRRLRRHQAASGIRWPSARPARSDQSAWGLGFTEIASDMACQASGPLGRDLRRHYTVLIGTCSFAFRLAIAADDSLVRRVAATS